MMFPIINIKAVGVELSHEKCEMLTRRLAPLSRLILQSSPVEFDVIVRQTNSDALWSRYAVSVRMRTETEKYYAIANEYYLERAAARLRDDLRRSISKYYSTTEQTYFSRTKEGVHRHQYQELFA